MKTCTFTWTVYRRRVNRLKVVKLICLQGMKVTVEQADAKEKILDLVCGNERIREKSGILL